MQKVEIASRGLQLGLQVVSLILGLFCSRTIHEKFLGISRQNGDLWTEWFWLAVCATVLAPLVRVHQIVCATLLLIPPLVLRVYGYVRQAKVDENLLPFVVGLDTLITICTTAWFFAMWWICSKFWKPA
jgi:hypothetical protein